MATKVRTTDGGAAVGETGELRLGYAEFAGSVVMLGKCQMDSWHLRFGIGLWQKEIDHNPLIGGT